MNEEKVKRAIELMKLGKSFGLEAKEFLTEEATRRGFVLGATFDSPFHLEEGRYTISEKGFYLTDKGEFNVGGKCGITIYHNGEWAEIVKEVELVEGEIYYVEDNSIESRLRGIFRHKSIRSEDSSMLNRTECYYFSAITDFDGFTIGDNCVETNDFIRVESDGRTFKLATKKQKKKLIKAEVKNGYFHELNKK